MELPSSDDLRVLPVPLLTGKSPEPGAGHNHGVSVEIGTVAYCELCPFTDFQPYARVELAICGVDFPSLVYHFGIWTSSE
jgi:hypothetical protein